MSDTKNKKHPCLWTIHGDGETARVVKADILENHEKDGWYLFRYQPGQGFENNWKMGRRKELFYDTEKQAKDALCKRLTQLIEMEELYVSKAKERISAWKARRKELKSGN